MTSFSFDGDFFLELEPDEGGRFGNVPPSHGVLFD